MTAHPLFPSPAELTLLTNEEFVIRWRTLVGEPPAIMLQDQAEMIRLLVASMAPAQGVRRADNDVNQEGNLKVARPSPPAAGDLHG